MNIKAQLPKFVIKILEKFETNNYEIYIVGGAVRDVILGKIIDDWDFTTNATPEQILKIFPEGFYDNKFGTVGIKDQSSENPFEITTYRKEYGYSDSRRPDKIEWGKTLNDDLSRRDFTINAMALKQIKEKTNEYQLIDEFEGQKDLKAKKIRAVGNPNERFSEDALRMMRAIRIASELKFTIEDKTLEAIKKNANLIIWIG